MADIWPNELAARDPSMSWTTIALELLVLGTVAIAFKRVRGTTLAAPAVWGMAAAAALILTDVLLAPPARPGLSASLWRYFAAVGTFCPLTAVLGAKRPQDRGWQWIVASLWLVLLVPAGQALSAPSGTRLELFAPWKLLHAALIAMTLLNYLPTRFALAAILFSAGQTVLLSPFLLAVEQSGVWRLAGVGLMALAAMAALVLARRVGGPTDLAADQSVPRSLAQMNQRWATLRDGWGAFWGLRVMQRINQTAQLSGWPIRLQWWAGFEACQTPMEPQTLAHVEQTLDALLRRFERGRTPPQHSA